MNEKQELVIRTLSYLEEHLQETLSLQTVAQLMNGLIPMNFLNDFDVQILLCDIVN